MRALPVIALGTILISGCAMSDAKTPAVEMGECSAAGAQSLIGDRKSEALGQKAMKLTGTVVIRWIMPGQPVTMDYRTDRLNMELDAKERVIRITCG
jgi:hypothetical protein